MKTKQNSSIRASALQTTFSVTLISLSAALLALAVPARHQFERKPAGTSVTLQNPHHGGVVLESSAAAKQTNTRKSVGVEFSETRQRIGGREVAGFSTRRERRAQEDNLTSPAGLKPVEQEAWLAMAQRQGASEGMEFSSFYPARYGEPFVAEAQGIRVAVRPVGGTDSAAQIDNGQVIYRGAYPGTDSMHEVSSERSEEFLFLQDDCAPREFGYELSELSAGTRMELVKGEVRFTNKAGQGVKIEAPWLIEANGVRRVDAVHWELDPVQSTAGPQRLRLVVAPGLRYPVVIDPSWTPTGSMGTARFEHTATLLPNGKVLVAGGQSGNWLSSAELYDPASGTWTATGSMGTARAQHTATLLPNGQVLVAGGDNPYYLSSAELYDPASGTWTATGSMSIARVGPATLLPSGKVLVAGGYNGSYLSNAELYDPASGTWTATGSMGTARDAPATLLPSGKVLVAGGYNGSYLSSAELYDPTSGTWTATGSMSTAHSGPTATLLPSGQVLVAGGVGFGGYLSSAELYDPASVTWTGTGSMAHGRASNTATLLPNGQVLVAGGYNFGVFSSAELYDPATEIWTATDSMGTARDLHTATLLPSGQVLVAGGDGSSAYLSSAELYALHLTLSAAKRRVDGINTVRLIWSGATSANIDVYRDVAPPIATVPNTGSYIDSTGDTGRARYRYRVCEAGTSTCSNVTKVTFDPVVIDPNWTPTGSMGTARLAHTATLLPSGKVLVAGGSGNGGLTSSAELYDPASGTWTATGSMGTARGAHTATLLPSGQVLVAGGVGTDYLSSAELYDPASGTWTATGSMASSRSSHTGTLLSSGKVLVVGGYGRSGTLSNAELYDPATGLWTATGSMGTARYFHTETLLPSGKVLVAGGNNTSVALSSAELYDPATGLWTAIGSMGTARQFHTATLLPSGKVLVAGGFNFNDGTLSSAELYDPASGMWTAADSMSTTRYLHTATLLFSGQVLVAGGFNGGYLSSAELYDPATGTWTATGSMGHARYEHTATLLPLGNVLVAGGYNGGVLGSAELYDPRLTLSAAKRRVDGINTVRLTWSGATSANIDVYRDVAPPIATVPNTGSYIDSTGDTGQARYEYRVCEAGTSTCSNVTKVTFPP